ncbi:hypothetical protein PspLS_01580 [Pyricularia sp. CBS 133598]|nr:hypothetical protein PspLS_01580 [Pyricularia sp. CBS 133598]
MHFKQFLAATVTLALSPPLALAMQPAQTPPGRMREGYTWFPGDPSYECVISIYRPAVPGSGSRHGQRAEVIYLDRRETVKVIKGKYSCSVDDNCERPDCNLPPRWHHYGRWGLAYPARKNTYFNEDGVREFNTLATEKHKRLYDCRVAIWRPSNDPRKAVGEIAEATHFDLGESVPVLRGISTCRAESKCGDVVCNLPEGYKYQSITGGPFQPMQKSRAF